ncbi:MAG: riboflavin biosynthesis protein RibF [Gemmataceae bacterium]
MSHFHIGWTEYPPEVARGGSVTIGNFDGVHRGHQALVAGAKRLAPVTGGPTVAVTFDPPPLSLLHPPSAKLPLSTVEDRAAGLHQCGADHVVTIRTEPGLLALTPEAFFEDVLRRQLDVKALVEGTDFHFGRQRIGDVNLLKSFCERDGIGFEVVQPVLIDGEPVSSSRVRMELNRGHVAEAAALLGRPYSIRGRVVEGAKRGRSLGFPTANLDGVETLVPAVGVYAMKVCLDGVDWPAAANVGPNPTFGEEARKIEIHLIGFSGNLYGRDLTAEFVARLRDTKPFASIDALKAQLAEDIAAASKITFNLKDLAQASA